MIKSFKGLVLYSFFKFAQSNKRKIKGSKYAYQKESDSELPIYEKV